MLVNFADRSEAARQRLASRLGKSVGPLRDPHELPKKVKTKSNDGYSVLERRAPIDPADDGFFLAIFLLVVVFTLMVGYTLLRHEVIAELTGLENLRPK